MVDQAKNNVKSLKALKDNGHKIGKLKFKREVKSVNLKETGKDYRVDRNKSAIKIAKVPGWMHVKGVEQLFDTPERELANAHLVKKPSGYYLQVTTYVPREYVREHDDFILGTVLGIDMGISTNITCSDGVKFSVWVPEPKRLKRIQRKLAKNRRAGHKGSKNHEKLRQKQLRCYEKMDNLKDNAANQIVHELMRNEVVYFQDENLGAWKVRFGKVVHHSIMGRVKTRLLRHPRAIMLKKYVPTTGWCDPCQTKTKHELSQRTFVCGNCGRTADRDVHAAGNMAIMGQNPDNVDTLEGKIVPTERGEQAGTQVASQKPVVARPSVPCVLRHLKDGKGLRVVLSL